MSTTLSFELTWEVQQILEFIYKDKKIIKECEERIEGREKELIKILSKHEIKKLLAPDVYDEIKEILNIPN